MYKDLYQYALIALGVIVTALFGVFWMRELFPEYKIYQKDYVALEQFRSTYTHEPPPDFQLGVKQLVLERDDKGPPLIDRCISCHVALQFPHFSPTRLAKDINGNIELDSEGHPVQVPNEDYVWAKLDQEIAKLEQANQLKQAERYKAIKTAKVEEHVYDVTKVLRMHPLMGRETYPFEYHPVEEYGCVTCHSGNGRGLTTEKAHGPVFDGEYEIEYTGPVPKFTEQDPANDPAFAKMFNHKPGPKLLFQTSPILIGPLIQSRCISCHQESATALQRVVNAVDTLENRRQRQSAAIQSALNREVEALASTVEIYTDLQKNGLAKTLQELQQQAQNYTLPQEKLNSLHAQIKTLTAPDVNQQKLLKKFQDAITASLGDAQLAEELAQQAANTKGDRSDLVQQFLVEHRGEPQAKGSIFEKENALSLDQALMHHIQETQNSFQKAANDQNVISAIVSDIDDLTANYHRGQQLYLSQACYACHRIAGFARGGVGPDLTREGRTYPWFLKESIVWPQADLPTSTMPNYRLDHEELRDLMTYLLGQTGENHAVSSTAYKISIQDWEAGKKLPWEKPVQPDQIHDLRFAMTVFAEQGCSACHRLKGFESNVGYSVEKEKVDFDKRYQESEWFQKLFPEQILGSELVKVLETNSAEIDRRIVNDVRQGSILEEIDRAIPGELDALYTPFKYAARSKNDAHWKERVHRVLMVFIQEYGLGRLVGPRPNWSGVYRSDEWLMEHFKAPTSHSPRSIMPVFPFDDTKFYALTNMLDVLGKRNRDEVRAIWEHRGFNPEQAYKIHCSQCHGDYMQGNGPVAAWIYPIPKNLRNADFLRNLTKERVVYSIKHGVKGTPMPPWGEVGENKPQNGPPELTNSEISQLADWIFSTLPGGNIIRSSEDVPKWQYSPEDVMKELAQEGNQPILVPDEKADTSNFFDVIPNPKSDPDKDSYYIKQKYYTEANIEAGRAFFVLNCAPCHGSDADGSSLRAEAMRDAKPRMLTNLDWIDTRDDLRLLRSIKFGVPGTAMNPWGDLTSSLQRLQLVMFIRSLTREQQMREELNATLYQVYAHEILIVEDARAYHFKEGETIDATLRQLKEQIIKERNIYQTLGNTLVSSLPNEELFKIYLKLIKVDGRFTSQNGELKAQFSLEREKEKEALGREIIASISDTKLKHKIVSDLAEAVRSRQEQKRLYNDYEERRKQKT